MRYFGGQALLRLSLCFLACISIAAVGAEAPRPRSLIGYTEFRTNVAGGRQQNIITMRAAMVRADGSGRRLVDEKLSEEPNSWTQFAGWSPDGRTAVIGRGWESPENARWEEEHKEFRFTPEGWLLDVYLVNLDEQDANIGKPLNISAIDRVSFYNSGLFFWPHDPKRLGFQALIGGNSHPFSMDRDGRNKRDLTADSREFAYGFSASPDGKRIAYHKNYKIYVADADGSHVTRIETDQPFNFMPQWSQDSSHVLFVAGEHYNCHPHIASADGSGLRKIADRGGYRGMVEFLDVPDLHGGSSDTPVWSADGKSIFYTAKVESRVELFRATLDGKSEQLTHSSGDALHYHPQTSADGQWLLFGSKQNGVRQLYVMRLTDKETFCLTNLKPGHAAMWAHWQPARTSKQEK